MKKRIFPILILLALLWPMFLSMAQNTPGEDINSAQQRADAGNFTVLTPFFLEGYARWLCNMVEKEPNQPRLLLLSSEAMEVFTNFERGQADLAIGLNPFPEKKSEKKMEILKSPTGQDILSIALGKTGIVLLVHTANPLKGLTLFQADAIFSSDRKCGYPFNIIRWGQVGLSGAWLEQPIHLYGLTRQSLTYRLFQQMVLCEGSIKKGCARQIDTSDVIARVSNDKRGIGFACLSKDLKKTKALPLAAKEESDYFLPTDKNILSGTYPLTRTIFVFVKLPEGHRPSLWKRLFIQKALEGKGQAMLSRYGMVPLYRNGAKEIDSILKDTWDGHQKGKRQ